MKILLRVLGTIFGFVAVVACLLGSIRNMRDASDAKLLAVDFENGKAQIEQMKQAVESMTGDSATEMNNSIKEMEDTFNSIPDSGTFATAAYLTMALGLLALMLIIFHYVNNPKIVTILFVLTIITGIATIVASPEVAETLTGGVSNRKLSYFAAVPAILAALTAFGVSRMKKKIVIA